LSYARFSEGESEVYVYRHIFGDLRCCSCRILANHLDFVALTEEDMLAHLNEHRALGHLVPDRAFTRLQAEIQDRE
jgi:hypothetical protein